MRFALVTAAFLGAAAPAFAGVSDALDDHILPSLARFTEAAAGLADAAELDCTPGALSLRYNAAFDAWLAIGDVKIGPTEAVAPSIAYWPDTRGLTRKTLARLIADEDPVIDDLETFAELSVAGRGLFALEMLLFDDAFDTYKPGSYSCRLAQTLTADLSAQATGLETAWADGYAEVLRSAGSADNATYLTEDEAVRALYTQLTTSLEFTADTRLGRPMGTFERPRPARAEAWRSQRSLTNVVLATEAAVALADGLADWDLPATQAALDAVHVAASKIDDPGFQKIEDPSERFKVEVLQQKVRGVVEAVMQEIGEHTGVSQGFNAGDGD